MDILGLLSDFAQTGISIYNSIIEGINNTINIYNINPGLLIFILFAALIFLLCVTVFRQRIEQMVGTVFSYVLIIIALLLIIAVVYVTYKYLTAGVFEYPHIF